MKAISNVQQSGQYDVSTQKAFRQGDAPDRRVVQSALEPLTSMRVRCSLYL